MATEFATRLTLIAVFVMSVRGVMAECDFVGAVKSGLLVAAATFVVGWLLGYLANLLVREVAQADVTRLLQQFQLQVEQSSTQES